MPIYVVCCVLFVTQCIVFTNCLHNIQRHVVWACFFFNYSLDKDDTMISTIEWTNEIDAWNSCVYGMIQFVLQNQDRINNFVYNIWAYSFEVDLSQCGVSPSRFNYLPWVFDKFVPYLCIQNVLINPLFTNAQNLSKVIEH